MRRPRLLRRTLWPEYEERLVPAEPSDAKSEAEEAGVVWPWPAADPPVEPSHPWASKFDGS